MWKILGYKKKCELCRGIERNERRERFWREEMNGVRGDGRGENRDRMGGEMLENGRRDKWGGDGRGEKRGVMKEERVEEGGKERGEGKGKGNERR